MKSAKDGKKKLLPATESGDSLAFLRSVVSNGEADPSLRMRAAIALAQYEHTKSHDGGKKTAAQNAAEAASDGRFATKRPPPKLIVNNR